MVSGEFATYRELLARDLRHPKLDVAVQEDFGVGGGTTLEKIDVYIRSCDGVIHLIGKSTGSAPEEAAVATLLAKYPDLSSRLPPLSSRLSQPQPGISYSQWEAYLAIYHKRPLFVYRPTDFELTALSVPRGAHFVYSAEEEHSQREHYRCIGELGHDRGQFINEERLSSAVLRDLVEILPRLEPQTRVDISQITKYSPHELIGRESETELLHVAWAKCRSQESGRPHIVTFVAPGGVGKTSLVANWAAELAHRDWPGCDGVFAWSFYSQGSQEQAAVSSDDFLAQALVFFGDPAMADSTHCAFDKGRRLAKIIGAQQALLILDGLEPLQYPPASPLHGEIKDEGLSALLGWLAAANRGLCVITTRCIVRDLRNYIQTTAPTYDLERLSNAAGVRLLRAAGITSGTNTECENLVEDVGGHALTLQILGQFIARAHRGDIRARDRVKLEKADARTHNGHAFRAMDAYVEWLEDGSDEALRELAVLRIAGLFDRPAGAACLDALRREPVIPGLTEALADLEDDDWDYSLSVLGEAKLITVVRAEGSGELITIDIHPLLREYFALELNRKQPEAWRAAHLRLYEFLAAYTPDKPDARLEDLQPLYQAVVHGCQAGRQHESFNEVYVKRIQRGSQYYPHKRLGAVGTDLSCIGAFFSSRWSKVSDDIPIDTALGVLDSAIESLHSVGRLLEAQQAIAAMHTLTALNDRTAASIDATILLSEVSTSLGQVAVAIRHSDNALAAGGSAFQQKICYVSRGVALHQKGSFCHSAEAFQRAEALEKPRNDGLKILRSLQGFEYCELLLDIACRSRDASERRDSLCNIENRAEACLQWAQSQPNGLALGLAQLAAAKARIAGAAASGSAELELCGRRLDQALAQIRRAGDMRFMPRALLARATFRCHIGNRVGPDSAQSDLDEAWDIALRGPMKLVLADIHLNRARDFTRETPYPWGGLMADASRGPQTDLAAAHELIESCGYHRRDSDLAAARRAVLGS
jgi:hypothetical protein